MAALEPLKKKEIDNYNCRKKQYFEAVLLYAWLHGIESDDGYWEEYCDKVGLNE